ncbi:kinase-like protein [Stereum hirsutum FP-91666 SS1]|uniref:kinase-like protein n=1 Tax=Stereum hirsutum (strain FP-91666) TaxID=721885 RepID=UPI000440EF5C|nr:kinase-like protein [Stereum hirsutum FP-91666 SS1]EIM90527.1 kinase-like protein [Stereum hirsutum FP-91666 SS1]
MGRRRGKVCLTFYPFSLCRAATFLWGVTAYFRLCCPVDRLLTDFVRRNQTVSSTSEQKKAHQPVSLPPMQMSALPQATAQRVANLKASTSSNGSSSTTLSPSKTGSSSSRVLAPTTSSLQRQSDASLRNRNQLPTIAGSPSVLGVSTSSAKEARDARDMPPPSLNTSNSSFTKETPTKIPRIHSRGSTVTSPGLKGSTSSTVGSSRRQSVNLSSGMVASASANEPSPLATASIDEFGVLAENGDGPTKSNLSTVQKQPHLGTSPSSNGSSTRHASANMSGSTSGIPRKGNRESMSFSGLRKGSTSSVTSLNAVPPSGGESATASTTSHRFAALSPSKGLKLLTPKVSLSHTKNLTHSSHHSGASAGIHQSITGTPSSSRQSLAQSFTHSNSNSNTPSPVPIEIDEEELAGDEEMMHYIKRQQQKKLAHGATQAELDVLLNFPEPISPGQPISPNHLLKSSQRQHLSEYERKEVLDYPAVYYIGAGSDKKPAHPDRPTNNFGYDDERGDYLVVNHDHLAFRYEVIDTLGKGSFGQVLHCRDHCTGESVAIKIIRNKKRFHHQALVEIKILDNLRKWDSEEKHHVIKMTEHFYFRNHLCIAMELLSINLYELIKANNFVGFTTALIRRFTSQMLMSLQLMRHHRIVHCDLKPENVLLRHPAKSAIKVIDFGSSCLEHEKIYTYIQSRFYRSPEVILGMNYHMAIDMWSLGCILAELYTGFPIFPGENEQEQLSCIMEVLGVPDKEFVNRSSRKRLFFDSTGAPRPVVNSKGRRRRPGTKTLAQVLRCDDDQFVDFIAKCLVWDPERRMKPQNAMRHAFILAGKGRKTTTPAPSEKASSRTMLSSSSNLSTRGSKPTETPKKSQISAPTPLTARSSRTNNTLPATPNASTSMHSLGSARSYRSSQNQGVSSSHYSSRTLNAFAVRYSFLTSIRPY